MKILTHWLRSYLPVLNVDDTQLAEDLTLRGIAVEAVFELSDTAGDSDGALFDMDITTNRVDAMNHYGIAREAAAIYNLPLHPLDTALPISSPGVPCPVRIDSDAEAFCGRFTAQVVRDLHIAPSEGSVLHFFTELAQKPISNAVDITNFVLLGMGHPTHAFDLDKIDGGIVVRRARAGEQIKLLDGTTRTLVPEDLVIADHAKALSLAGIMGGFDSMITAETRNILIEAAWFDPVSIRASSRRHLLHTDASHRFERGADFAAPPVANALVARHILKACGGHLEGDLIDLIIPAHEALTASRPPVTLSVKHVQRHLGQTISPEGITANLIVQYLTALGCTLTATAPDTYQVSLPSWRLDLTREIDLIEEIARVYGYNGFANTLPTPGIVLARPTAQAEQAVRTRLFALGFSEAISSSFTSSLEASLFAPGTPAVPLENPLSEEAAFLRPSLLPGMVTMLAHNLNRDVLIARLFEAGTLFSGSSAPESSNTVQESLSLALGFTGAAPATPLHTAQDAPFFELKGALESLCNLFEAPPLAFTAQPSPAGFEPARSATALLDGKPIAMLGQLASSESARRKLRQPVYLVELNLTALLALPLRHVTARELSRFGAVERDFSFTFPDATRWLDLANSINALSIQELQKLGAAEIFRDPKKNGGHFSILIRIVFQSHDRTLRDEELAAWSVSIISALETLGGVLRA